MAGPWRTVAEMQGRDLLRRHAALLLLIGMPLSWYAAEAAVGIDYAIGTGVLAMAWSASAASLFAFVGARHIDQRLVLAGHRPRDIMRGRLVALLAVTWAIALAVGIVMVASSRPERPGDVFLALALTALVSTSVGWLTAALVPRELEGTLILIGLVGLQVSIPTSGTADLVIPYYGPLRLTDYERSPVGPVGPTAQALVWAVLLGLVALVLWRRHVSVHRPPAEASELPDSRLACRAPYDRRAMRRDRNATRRDLVPLGSVRPSPAAGPRTGRSLRR